MNHSELTLHPRQAPDNFSHDQPPRSPRVTRLLILLPAALTVAALLAAWMWVKNFLPEGETLPPLLHESWDILSIDGVRVGGSHQRQWQTRQQGQPKIVTEATTYLRVLRQGQAVHLQVVYRCEETAAGELLCCRSRQQTDDSPPVVQTGQVTGGRLQLRQLLATGPSEHSIDWPPATRGYFGIEASLRRQLLVPGERRKLQYLIPLLNQIAQVDLHAIRFETIEMASGLARLLRIDSTIHRDGSTTHRTLWCDGAGEVIRSFEPAMKLASERTTRAVAQCNTPSPQYDILIDSRVPIDPAIEDPQDQTELAYQVQLQDHWPAETFASDDRQQVEPIDRRRALLTVQATWLATGNDVALPAETQQPQALSNANPMSQPEAETLLPSRFIQSRDPRIVALAERVLTGQGDSSVQQLAVGLERLVHDWIHEKSYLQVFASASEVYQSHRGDCTEHAVLLAAVCRARKIPARLALGLIYVPAQQGFLYHLWTEGWWDNRWHGLDASLGRGGIGATHLKLRTFTLAGDNPLTEMASISQVIGQLEIRVMPTID